MHKKDAGWVIILWQCILKHIIGITIKLILKFQHIYKIIHIKKQ